MLREVNQEMLDRLNGCYTQLLRIAHNVDWTAHACNSFLYGNGTIPPLADTIAKRTLRFAGHTFRVKDQLVPDIMMFEPSPTASKLSYLKTLCHLTGATDNVGSMRRSTYHQCGLNCNANNYY